MPRTVDEIRDLKDEVEQLKDKLTRNRGKLEQLKSEKSYTTLEELRIMLSTFRSKREKLEKDFSQKLKEYKEFYNEQISGSTAK